MKKLCLNDYQNIARWSSFYGTWWWIKYNKQLDQAKKIIEPVFLKSIDEISDNEYVASMYAIWAAWWSMDGVTDTIKAIISKVEHDIGWKIWWLFPVEVSIEALVADICAKLNIALIDADACGWRAVPEATYDNFHLYNKSVAPIYYGNANWIDVITRDIVPDEIDWILRESIKDSWWSIFCIDHIGQAKDMKEYLSVWTISRSMRLWEKLSQTKTSISDILTAENISIIDYCVVEKADLSKEDWFYAWTIILRSDDNEYSINVQNEYMHCFDKHWSLVLNFPDLLMLVDEEKKMWIHSTDIHEWMSLLLCSKLAEERWQWFEYNR